VRLAQSSSSISHWGERRTRFERDAKKKNKVLSILLPNLERESASGSSVDQSSSTLLLERRGKVRLKGETKESKKSRNETSH